MLAVILKLLSILGIILLVLLGALLVLLLLILFMPIVYRFDGEKSESALTARLRFRWLFGLVRVGYSYPKPGNIIVKALCFTVYDSGKEKENPSKKKTIQSKESPKAEQKAKSETETVLKHTDKETSADSVSSDKASENDSRKVEQEEILLENDLAECEKKSIFAKLFAKYEKIKYTIRQVCDKIKHILENIDFYVKLLQNEDTKLLFSHACKRFGRIFCHIRPRKIKADVVFGMSSPDTTGYLYGIYGMFSPKLGQDICITPDFTRQVLTGDVHAAGRITLFYVLMNMLALFVDRRLRLLIGRLRSHTARAETV